MKIISQRAAVLMLAAPIFVAACSKSIGDRGCDDVEVQTLAKKLIVMKVNDYSAEKTDSQRMMDSYMKRANKDSNIDTTLNTIKTQHLKTDSVRLDGVVELRNPKVPAAGASSMSNQNTKTLPTGLPANILYVCSATAHIRLPPGTSKKIAGVATAVPNLLNAETDTLSPTIIYTTERNDSNQLEVGFTFENRLMEMVLGAALRPR
jgi:hypothetical protein